MQCLLSVVMINNPMGGVAKRKELRCFEFELEGTIETFTIIKRPCALTVPI